MIIGLGVGSLLGYVDFSKSKNGVVCFSGVGSQGSNNIRINLIGKDLLFFAGCGFTSVGSQVILEGRGESIILGNDYMLSWEVFVRNYDSHAIVDLKDGRVVNRPGSILIGAHVWLGQRVFIVNSCRIGHGAIVEASCVVTKDVPSISAIAGNPARVVRSNVSWSRESNPNVEVLLDKNFIKSVLNLEI